MNLTITAGKDQKNNDVLLNLATHRFLLLTGSTGTGKSIFHNYIYKQLVAENLSEEIGFIFLDMTRVDFCIWKSPYISKIETDAGKAIAMLEQLAKEEASATRHTIVQIEECDIFVNFTERAENAVRVLLANRSDVTLIYSTSRPGGNALSPNLLALIDTRIVFELSTQKDLDYVLGSENNVMPIGWGKILLHKGQTTQLQPFTAKDVEILGNFNLVDA